MIPALEALEPATRHTVETYINCYLYRSTMGLKEVLTEDVTFQGAFSAGILRSRDIVESHLRQSFRGLFSKGTVQFRALTSHGNQIEIEWELLCPGESGMQSAEGRTTLDLDESGLIRRIRADWDPKPLLGWKHPNG